MTAKTVGQTVGERLRMAIERHSNIRAFQRELEKKHKGVPGVSRVSVHRFLKGTADPPLAFLRAAADVTDVREAWLTSGDQPMVDGSPRKPRDRAGLHNAPWADFTEHVPVPLNFAWMESVGVLWQRHSKAQALGVVDTQGPGMAIVGAAIAAPLRVLGVDLADVPPAELRDYIAEASLALRRLVISLLPPEERHVRAEPVHADEEEESDV